VSIRFLLSVIVPCRRAIAAPSADAGGTEGEGEVAPPHRTATLRNDPKVVEAARELRERYIEQINAPGSGLLLPPNSRGACGTYDVSRQLEAAPSGTSSNDAAGRQLPHYFRFL